MGVVVAIIIVVATANYVRNPDLIDTPAGLGGATSTPTTTDASRSAPELDKDRKVTEVDCTKPVDPSAGNIRCK